MQLISLIAFSDPAREDSATLVTQLKNFAVRMVMVTSIVMRMRRRRLSLMPADLMAVRPPNQSERRSPGMFRRFNESFLRPSQSKLSLSSNDFRSWLQM
jgi:hypothetical protein